MPQDLYRQGLDIVRRDIIASVQGGMGAAAKQQGLGGPGSGADQNALVLSGLTNDIHQVGGQFILDPDLPELASQLGQGFGADHSPDRAALQDRLGGLCPQHASAPLHVRDGAWEFSA